MPSKSRKVASRQAELRRRRRRTKGGGQEFDAGPTESSGSRGAAVVEPDAGLGESVAPEALATQTDGGAIAEERGPAVGTAATASTPQRSRRAARRAAQATAELAPEYPYLGTELKRVAIIASAIMIALVILTVFLR